MNTGLLVRFMQSDKFKSEQNEQDGAIFIDRDPAAFQVVVDFLRYGATTVPATLPATIKEKLLIDCDYYMLPDLRQVVANTVSA
jgi:hypothetical protein